MTTVVTVGSAQAAGGADMDMWMLVLAILGILVSLAVGGIAAYFAWRSVVLTRQGLVVQDEQLQLQKDQAAMIPRLEVSDIRFYRPESSSAVLNVLREVEENRRRDEQERIEEEERKRKSAEWEREQAEKRQNEPFYSVARPEINPCGNFELPIYRDPLRYEAYRYDGPEPNAILDFQIANKGKTAAHDISGTLRLDASYLQPLDFPAMDDRGISGPDDGFFRIDLVRVPELLPGHTAEYQIALQAKHPGDDNKVQIKYEFITPDGIIDLKDGKAVEMVPSSPR